MTFWPLRRSEAEQVGDRRVAEEVAPTRGQLLARRLAHRRGDRVRELLAQQALAAKRVADRLDDGLDVLRRLGVVVGGADDSAPRGGPQPQLVRRMNVQRAA